jgi:hypothetical protein
MIPSGFAAGKEIEQVKRRKRRIGGHEERNINTDILVSYTKQAQRSVLGSRRL